MEEIQVLTRRELIKLGVMTGGAGALGFALAACTSASPTANAQSASPGASASASASAADVTRLNAALNLEYQAIWAYTAAAGTGKLDGSDAISAAVKKLALKNAADHTEHAKVLVGAVQQLNGSPTTAKSSYDLSAYLNAGEGHLNDLPGIARLALALEVDAALAYAATIPTLQTNSLVQAAASVLPIESAHAAAIRCLLAQAGLTIDNIIPTSFVTADQRAAWVIKM